MVAERRWHNMIVLHRHPRRVSVVAVVVVVVLLAVEEDSRWRSIGLDIEVGWYDNWEEGLRVALTPAMDMSVGL